VHNIRIERLWVDVMRGYIGKWAGLFTDLEQNHGLDIDSDNHIWLLHYLFLGGINDDALAWSAMWNRHPMRLPSGQTSGLTPVKQFLLGQAENGLRGLEQEDPAYEEDGEDYGFDWGDFVDARLRRSIEERRGLLEHPLAAPPRWSRVEVTTVSQPPIDGNQVIELDTYISTRINIHSINMDDRRMMWIHGLRYFSQLQQRD
jgi:hypothetical protein